MKAKKRGSFFAVLPFSVYAAIFIVAPLILILIYSLTDKSNSFTLANFAKFFNFSKPIYINSLLRSIYLAFIATLICLLIGYPVAYILAGIKSKLRNFLAFLFILPMWMNFLLRTYAWMFLLERNGMINMALKAIGLPTLNIMNTQSAVVLGMVYNFLPFMIMPIYNMLCKMDHSLLEASHDLGANHMRTFFKVTLPLTMPGVYSGITMTFMPAVSTFIITQLLGGGEMLIGDLIDMEFRRTDMAWGFGSAMAIILLVLILLSMWISNMVGSDDADSGGIIV